MTTPTTLKESVSLPKTDFPMRGNLPKREPERLAQWESQNLYSRLLAERADAELFVLHDGPPYANGNIHIGHAVNKVLKDFIVRTKSMRGMRAPYVPGWDCHGLPIELKVEEQFIKKGRKKEDVPPAEFRTACRQYAKGWVDSQREEFKRLGILGDWDNPYLTMNFGYEAAIVRELGKLMESGHLVRGAKPIHWCPSCVTALAEAEIEYHDHTSPAIFVAFPFADGEAGRHRLPGEAALVIRTTTPWTLPANQAVALHPDFDYVALDTDKGQFVVAEALQAQFLEATGLSAHFVGEPIKGRDLEGAKLQHPFLERWVPVILGDHVTLEAGTGAVHTAPGHGQEDFEAGQRYNLPVENPVDDHGRFVEGIPHVAGMTTKAANKVILEVLEGRGRLLAHSPLNHSYPHCWRCKGPILFRATEQWFIQMEHDELRARALAEIDLTQWIPSWGRERIHNMVSGRPDWCISRQRAWGAPITVVECGDCRAPLLDRRIAERVAEFVEQEGVDAWFERPVSDFLPEGETCPHCGSTEFTKETDILDVWFDSGVSQAAVLKTRDDLAWPADLYLEGSDQHRGWFQSSLLASVAANGQAPYKAVLTHGFVLDAQGRKMSKSLGNTVAPQEVIGKFGADVLRLWVASEDTRSDVRIGGEILDRQADTYRRLRNTLRYLLGSLDGFDPATDTIAWDDLLPLERFMLDRARRTGAKVLAAYEGYDFQAAARELHRFCNEDLSAFYLDVLKDRLYIEARDGALRKSAQTALYLIGDRLIRWLAPLTPFTADEAWECLPGKRESSVQLATFAAADWVASEGEVARYTRLMGLREGVLPLLEILRRDGKIGASLEAEVRFRTEDVLDLTGLEEEVADILIVSKVTFSNDLPNREDQGFPGQWTHIRAQIDSSGTATSNIKSSPRIWVGRLAGEKCDRCWHIVPERHEVLDGQVCGRCRDVIVGAQ